MNAVTEYFHMGGYAVFVWPAFAVAAIVLTALLVLSVRDLRKERQLYDTLPRRRTDAEGGKAGDDS